MAGLRRPDFLHLAQMPVRVIASYRNVVITRWLVGGTRSTTGLIIRCSTSREDGGVPQPDRNPTLPQAFPKVSLKKSPAIQQPKATELPGQVSPPLPGGEPCAFAGRKAQSPRATFSFSLRQIVLLPGAPKGADEFEFLAAACAAMALISSKQVRSRTDKPLAPSKGNQAKICFSHRRIPRTISSYRDLWIADVELRQHAD